MADTPTQHFEHSVLEADIERLSKEIAEKREELERHGFSGREMVKKVIAPMMQSQAAVNAPTQPRDDNTVLPDYLYTASPEVKLHVEELIDRVFHKGIDATVQRARRAHPMVLDAFHDALTDKVYEELVSRKLL